MLISIHVRKLIKNWHVEGVEHTKTGQFEEDSSELEVCWKTLKVMLLQIAHDRS